MARAMTLACAAAGALIVAAAPVRAADTPFYISQVIFMATNFCPVETLPADGRLMKINENQALFSLLGTNYGGDGRTTFALPKVANVPTKTPDAELIACIATGGIFPSRR